MLSDYKTDGTCPSFRHSDNTGAIMVHRGSNPRVCGKETRPRKLRLIPLRLRQKSGVLIVRRVDEARHERTVGEPAHCSGRIAGLQLSGGSDRGDTVAFDDDGVGDRPVNRIYGEDVVGVKSIVVIGPLHSQPTAVGRGP